MVDVLFRSSMDVSSQPLVLPTNLRRRRMMITTQTAMYINSSPIAVSNKIKAIQARKPRLTIPSNYNYTDIRSLNVAHGGIPNFSVLTAERLVDRSKDIRLDRLSTRQGTRPSLLSTTIANQQSLLWSSYQSPPGLNKQSQTRSNSTTITRIAIESTKKQSPGGKIPATHSRQNRQPMTEQQNSLIPIESRRKSLSQNKSPLTTNNKLNIKMYENNEEHENTPNLDEDFEQYLQNATMKCADWLLKYVFNEKTE